MKKFRFLTKDKISGLPEAPGVYAFKKRVNLLYIGKAANIKERVKNHFSQPAYRDNLFINQVSKISYLKTDSEIEALVLEANLIKKYRPKYNIAWRDDKNYFFVGVTKEDFPRVFITHQPNLKSKILNLKSDYVGPFVEGSALKNTLRYLRKAFPYYTAKKHSDIPCPWCRLGLCPGPNPDKNEYKKNIRNLISVLKGKKKSALKELKKEMESASMSKDFEKAAKARDQIKNLEKILSHAIIFAKNKKGGLTMRRNLEKELKKLLKIKNAVRRIEGYDISNIQGEIATGSMVVFIDGEPDKNSYRKFKIKISGSPNDVAMIKEVLSRRFNHPEWTYPDLILIDGGKAQLNATLEIKNKKQKTKNIKVIALAKRQNELFIEDRRKPILLKNLPRDIFNLILQIRDEAHRFAISYHKRLRRKALLGS